MARSHRAFCQRFICCYTKLYFEDIKPLYFYYLHSQLEYGLCFTACFLCVFRIALRVSGLDEEAVVISRWACYPYWGSWRKKRKTSEFWCLASTTPGKPPSWRSSTGKTSTPFPQHLDSISKPLNTKVAIPILGNTYVLNWSYKCNWTRTAISFCPSLSKDGAADKCSIHSVSQH